MMLLKTIFLFEWQQLLRQRWMLVSLLLFMLISLLSIRSSNRTIESRFIQADSIREGYHRDYVTALQRFSDTLTDKGKATAKNAGLAVMVNYWLPQNAVKLPAPLAALSLGLTDIQPWYQQIRYTKSFEGANNIPVSNPVMLFAGNFDLAFVIIYLLPLLVLVYCYNLYASEKETGTLTMLMIHAGSIHRIIALKLLFRLLVLATLLLTVNALGFILAYKQSFPSFITMLLWCSATLLYLLFWITVTYVVLAFRFSGTRTGLYLVSCWMLVLIILPSLINTYVQKKHPLPMKDEIAAYRRHQGEEIWNTPARVLADSFNRYNPQYAASINPARDTLPLSTRYIAGYYDLLEKRMDRMLTPFQEKIKQRNLHFETLSNRNPSSLVQQWLNSLAGTQLTAYQDFSRQSDIYQQKWKTFLYGFHIPEKHLTPADYKNFPVFQYHAPALPVHRLIIQAGYLLCLVLLLTGAGVYIFTHKNRTS
ncbi:DUF3526 domain-containing protein [Chitinophaga ginsengisegetis]|uniref:DUF3526 domain-containing protein n=1 Tax=Chitinophaga ginsengisegetis TaxID=393003 RepID=UPI000DBA3612|nr:DUF3526 domain-containing protein [Chitinophaga ginsengisegetis]MDR6568217.1 ABC-2 type transport system permease protein [Chitinophaga ginsengisegetis]MDR6648552.1 ABC-2 type transport system permease protein [Chitinophaga ginsengisegetis]MDR6654298.1 ABC-2 type transport system permease protein [Chitinophaga ginsengisegetis]